MKLIVADDERRVRMLIKSIIPYAKYGFELVSEASNGYEALELCKKHRPDILVTDIKMPGISGLDLISELKEFSADTKVLIISGYDDFEYAKTAIKLGVFDYILKPIDEDEFCQALVGMRTKILKENIHNKDKIKSVRTTEGLSNYINKLVQDVLELYSTQTEINPVEVAKSFLEKNYQLDISLDQLSKSVHMNPTYFCGMFKNETGYSFVEYRNMIRIKQARRLLSTTDFSVTELITKIGYNDPKYFSKLFKKLTGFTPCEYRNSFQNKSNAEVLENEIL